MDESDFEGSLILEKLAELDLVDEFLAAVDADDTTTASALMRRANIDSATIAEILELIAAAND